MPLNFHQHNRLKQAIFKQRNLPGRHRYLVINNSLLPVSYHREDVGTQSVVGHSMDTTQTVVDHTTTRTQSTGHKHFNIKHHRAPTVVEHTQPNVVDHVLSSSEWSGRLDSNQRPLRPERSALPG